MKTFSDLVILIVATTLVKNVVSELRFCYKGPHVIYPNDCPGGFYAKEALVTSCIGYARDADISVVQIGDDICRDGEDIANNTSRADAFTNLQFLKTTNGGGEPAEPFESIPCEDCLDEWEDANPSEDEHNDQTPAADPKVVEAQKEQNKKLFSELIDEDDENPSPDPLDEKYDANGFIRLYKLLAKSMRIMVQGCDGFIDAPFFSQVLKAMMSLLDKSNNTLVDIGIDEFKKVDDALNNCLNTKVGPNKGFTLVGTKCNNLAKVEGTLYPGKTEPIPYSLKAKSFRWYLETDPIKGPKYDPIVEAAWDAVDFVHGFCFSSFVSNFNYHHIYAIAMEALFPKVPIQQRWLYPALVKNDGQFWNNVLLTTDIKQTMKNLDACALAAYKQTPYLYRLDKPFYTMETNTVTVTAVNVTVGWSGTIGEYWDAYKKKGGFATASSSFGTCVKTNAQTEQVVSDLKKSCQ